MNQTTRVAGSPQKKRLRGFSLLEMLAVITILGILAALIIPRMGNDAKAAKSQGCNVNRGNIETQVQLWFRNKSAWPQTNLSDIGANTAYFPDGLPRCPVDGSAYQLNSATNQVTGHNH